MVFSGVGRSFFFSLWQYFFSFSFGRVSVSSRGSFLSSRRAISRASRYRGHLRFTSCDIQLARHICAGCGEEKALSSDLNHWIVSNSVNSEQLLLRHRGKSGRVHFVEKGRIVVPYYAIFSHYFSLFAPVWGVSLDAPCSSVVLRCDETISPFCRALLSSDRVKNPTRKFAERSVHRGVRARYLQSLSARWLRNTVLLNPHSPQSIFLSSFYLTMNISLAGA